MRVIIIKVMNDAVAELCRKDLSFLRVADDKAGGRAGLVGACLEFQTDDAHTCDTTRHSIRTLCRKCLLGRDESHPVILRTILFN